MRSRDNLHILLTAAITAAAALTPDGRVLAHGNNNDPAIIHACIDDKKGNVRIVPLNQDCGAGESRSHWAIVGPAGPAGGPGPQGPPGPPASSIDALDGLSCTREGFAGVANLTYAAGGIVVLTCEVNATEAALSPSPTSLQFNAVQTKTVTITNTGQLSSGPLAVSLTGSFFQITGDQCSGQTLAGGASCTVDVRFTDFTGLPRIGTLSISGTPGGTVQVPLTGSNLS